MLANATITDGDVSSLDNLVPDKAIIKFTNGYRSNEDISIPSSYSAPSNHTASFDSNVFDLTIKNSDGSCSNLFL